MSKSRALELLGEINVNMYYGGTKLQISEKLKECYREIEDIEEL